MRRSTLAWIPTLLWTGTEAVVWGGTDAGPSPANNGAAYDPGADHWTGPA